jgi:hypothetical protein
MNYHYYFFLRSENEGTGQFEFCSCGFTLCAEAFPSTNLNRYLKGAGMCARGGFQSEEAQYKITRKSID